MHGSKPRRCRTCSKTPHPTALAYLRPSPPQRPSPQNQRTGQNEGRSKQRPEKPCRPNQGVFDDLVTIARDPAPDPIPNSAVKTLCVNGTASQDVGESIVARSSNTPCVRITRKNEDNHRPFFLTAHAPNTNHKPQLGRQTPAPPQPHNTPAGWSSPVARQAHNLKVRGSNPLPATNTPEGHRPSGVLAVEAGE